MLPDWYAAWTKTHLVTFAIFADENVAAFASWWPAFSVIGVTGDELARATRDVLNSGPAPIKVSDHYHVVKKALNSLRADRMAVESESRLEDRGTCADCEWSAYVTVPHPRFCDATEWRYTRCGSDGNPIYTTAAVLCRCPAGQRTLTQQRQRQAEKSTVPVCMTLNDYEDRVNGNWRAQMRFRDEQQRRQTAAEASFA